VTIGAGGRRFGLGPLIGLVGGRSPVALRVAGRLSVAGGLSVPRRVTPPAVLR